MAEQRPTGDSVPLAALFIAAAFGAMLGISAFAFAFFRTPVPAAPQYAARPPISAQAVSYGNCSHPAASSFRSTGFGESVMLGDVQRIDLDCSGGRISPDQIELAAGVAVEVHIRGAEGCLSSLEFQGTGGRFDAASPQPVLLPALEPGVYPVRCSNGGVAALLVVR